MKNINYLIAAVIFLFVSGCKQTENFTTYFNTYYNANRLLNEAHNEFEYQDEKKRVTPKVFVPEPKIDIPAIAKTGPPPFMTEFIIEQHKLQPVKIKIDSIIIKCSKILAKHPKSDYVEKSLYLIAVSYFYRNEWLPSQIKCSELIDKFTDGDLSPDAHLLLSKNYLIQRKFLAGKVMLSRTVDIAWQKKRYDILSEAFRLEAELALYENDLDAAVKPYKQAIAQVEDEEVRARWLVDLGGLLYRMGKFNQAEKYFARVENASPDYQARFEGKLYQAQCLIRQGYYSEGEKILDELDDFHRYNEWKSNIYSARLTSLRLQKNDSALFFAEKFADSAYSNSIPMMTYYFERGMEYYYKNDYTSARRYLARARNQRSPVFATSERMYTLLNTWAEKNAYIKQIVPRYNKGEVTNDTAKAFLAMTTFELGRVHEQLGNIDSSVYYYKLSSEIAPLKDTVSARFIYAYARSIEEKDPILNDSLMELLVERYPKTEYGREALKVQGYTEKYLIDSVAELYSSGTNLRINKEYVVAVSQFLKLYNKYPDSRYAPRSLYAIGWVFEKNLKNIDSAYYYYQLLISKYPNSEYANDLKLSVTYLAALKSGAPLPDSLKTKTTVNTMLPVTGDTSKIQQNIDKKAMIDLKNKKSQKNAVDAKEAFQDPAAAYKKAKESLTNPDTFKPDINVEIPFKKLKIFGSDKDSTETTPPEVPKPDEGNEKEKKK